MEETAMSNKKSGRIAVPFLITIFIGLIIVGGAALFIYNYFGFGKEEKPSKPPERTASTATYEDSHTVLFILDVPEEKCSATYVLMRSVPKEKKLLFVGIPSNTIAIVDGKQASLADSYARGGASSAVNFSEQALGVSIDRYMTFNSEAFQKLCDIVGGVSYTVTVDIGGMEKNKEQYLIGSKIQKLITYPLYSKGEQERAYTASSIISSMINQADGPRLASNLDGSFNTIINMVTSDITSVDYKNRKNGIKDMLNNGTTISRFRILEGEENSGEFIIDKDACRSMVDEYFNDSEEASENE